MNHGVTDLHDRSRQPYDNDDLVQNHEDEARSLIRALVDAIHFFKRKKVETLAIIEEALHGAAQDAERRRVGMSYETQAASLEPNPYPRSRTRSKRVPLALKRDPEIAEFNRLALWDLHYLREIDEADISTGCTGKCSVVKGRIAHQGKNIKNLSLNNSSVVFIRIDS